MEIREQPKNEYEKKWRKKTNSKENGPLSLSTPSREVVHRLDDDEKPFDSSHAEEESEKGSERGHDQEK